jgi:hypothetical protein
VNGVNEMVRRCNPPLRRSIEAAVLRRIIDMQIHSIGIDLGLDDLSSGGAWSI